MAEAGERVIFGEDPDPRARPNLAAAVGSHRVAGTVRQAAGTADEAATDCRLERADGAFDGVAVASESLRDPGSRLSLLEGRLRVRVDPMAERDDLGPRILDRTRDS